MEENLGDQKGSGGYFGRKDEAAKGDERRVDGAEEGVGEED